MKKKKKQKQKKALFDFKRGTGMGRWFKLNWLQGLGMPKQGSIK